MTVMPREGDWTVDDLAGLPDDGLQYELADGMLLVTPAPRMRHQRVLGNLVVLMHVAVPAELEVFFAPVDYRPHGRTSLQPDLLVVRREDVGEVNITAPLLLAVEVLSPSTRSKDLLLKRGLYEQAGVLSFWVVDPDETSLIAWDLVDGAYVEVLRAVGDEVAVMSRPFRVDVTPTALLR